MAQSQRVAQYISDSESDNDMKSEPSNNRKEVKNKTKQTKMGSNMYIESSSFIDIIIYYFFIFHFSFFYSLSRRKESCKHKLSACLLVCPQLTDSSKN